MVMEERSRWAGQLLARAPPGTEALQLPAPSVPAAWHGGTAVAGLGCSAMGLVLAPVHVAACRILNTPRGDETSGGCP